MPHRKIFRLHLPTHTLVLGKRTLLMGVLNITPDSFSDGGKFLAPDRAIAHALSLQKAGAELLDIGAESTDPVRSASVLLKNSAVFSQSCKRSAAN